MRQQEPSTYPVGNRLSFPWLAAGALLMMLSTGRFSLAVAAWLAPVFLIRFFRSQRPGRGYLLVLLTLWVAYGIAWRSILNFAIFSALPVYAVMAFFIAFTNALPFLADRLLAPRLKDFASTLVYPLGTAAITFLYNLGSPIGSFGAVGYEQYSNQALIQLVSVTGIWGLIFLVSWLGPVVNWAWERSFAWAEVRRGLLGYVGVMGLVLLFGGQRLAFGQPQAGTVRIHGISPEYQEFVEQPGTEPSLEAIRSHMQKVNDVYLEAAVREARRGAQIVMWNEMAVGGVEEDANAFLARAQEVAQQEGIYLAMGVGIDFPGQDRQRENRLIVIAPSGEIVINQLKVGATIVDGVKQGDGVLQTVDSPYGTLAGAICWDTDFPMYIRQAGNKQVDILFVPNGEPLVSLGQMRAQQAVFRAIENGVSLARHDHKLGYSIATDPYGRILASTNVLAASEKVMVAQVPTHRVFTLYSVIGDLFGWLSVAGFVIVAGWAIFRRRKGSARGEGSSRQQQPTAG